MHYELLYLLILAVYYQCKSKIHFLLKYKILKINILKKNKPLNQFKTGFNTYIS